jgi:hypothetical protein
MRYARSCNSMRASMFSKANFGLRFSMSSAVRREIKALWDKYAEKSYCYVLSYNPLRNARAYRRAKRSVLQRYARPERSQQEVPNLLVMVGGTVPSVTRVGPNGTARCYRDTFSDSGVLPVKLRKASKYRVGIWNSALGLKKGRSYRSCFYKNLKFLFAGTRFTRGAARSITHFVTSHGITMKIVKSLKRFFILWRAGRGVSAVRLLTSLAKSLSRVGHTLCSKKLR